MPTSLRIGSLLVGLLALVVVAVAAGCSAAPPTLAGKEFVSETVNVDGNARPLVPGTQIRIQFTGNEISFSAGCNSMGGTYQFDGGTRMVLGNVFTTEMGCDAARHEQDAWLSELLGSGPTVRLIGETLAVDSGATQLLLIDREVAEPDANLVGPTWTLESIIDGDAVSSIPGGIEATLAFKDDGTVEVNAGCNRGSGTWAAVGGGIEFGPLMLTKMACQKDGGSVEGAVVSMLGAETVSAEIDSTRLTLTVGNQGLVYRAD